MKITEKELSKAQEIRKVRLDDLAKKVLVACEGFTTSEIKEVFSAIIFLQSSELVDNLLKV